MSREIKFRAWYKPTDYDKSEPKKPPRMVYFDELGYCDEYNHLKFQLAKESYDPKGGGYSNLRADADNFLAVMQFTGLRDKTGKEIYEGDIVSHRHSGRVNLVTQAVTIEPSRGVCVGNWPIGFDIEVIGNIHENPDLLAVGGGS